MPDDRDRKSSKEEADEKADEEQSESGARAKAERTKTPAPKPPADDDSDDEDDEDDEQEDEGDEDDEEEEAPKPKAAAKAAAPAKAAPARKRRPPPAKLVIDESTLAAPSRETLVWLGVMTFATLAMWGSARFACNAHPAQTRKPRDVSTAELSRDPKDAALEMQQRWNEYNFKGALELAKGPVAAEIEKAQADCAKDSAACEQKKKAAEDKALATASLLSRGPEGAKVRVVSHGGADGEKTVVYTVEQEGSGWKVSGIAKDAPPALPAPSAGQ